MLKANNNEIISNSNSRANRTVVNLFKNKKSKKSTRLPNIKATKKSNVLIFDTKEAFNYLWLAFIKAPILQHFDLENHIWIEINVSGYAISRVLSQ